MAPTENLSLILEKWKIHDKNQEICLIFGKSYKIDDFLERKYVGSPICFTKK